MTFQKIKNAKGKDEFVLVPVALFDALRDIFEKKMKDPLYRRLMSVPLDDEPCGEEEESLVAEAREEMKSRRGVSHQEVRRRLGL
jgi:hypothetical protein